MSTCLIKPIYEVQRTSAEVHWKKVQNRLYGLSKVKNGNGKVIFQLNGNIDLRGSPLEKSMNTLSIGWKIYLLFGFFFIFFLNK